MALAQYASAIQDLNVAIQLDPDDLRNLTLRADVHDLMGNLEAAVADLTRAIDMSDSLLGVNGDRGRIQFAKGKYEEAINDLTTEIDLDPGGLSNIELRGDAFVELHRYQEAIVDYRRCVTIEEELSRQLFGDSASDGVNPAAIDLRLKIAETLEKSGQESEAVKEYRAILRLDPDEPTAQQRLAEFAK